MRTIVLALALVAGAAPAFAQSSSDAVRDYSIATLDDARAAQFLPAALSTRHDAEWRLEWSGLDGRREGFSSQAYVGGFGAYVQDSPGHRRTWGMALGGGRDALRFGWSGYRVSEFGTRRGDHRFSALSRPVAWLSLAGEVDHAFEPKPYGSRLAREWTTAIAVRPLAFDRARAHGRGTRLTLTADLSAREDEPRAWARTRVGVECEPIDGLAFAVATRGHDEWRAGVTLRGLRGATSNSGAMRDGDKTNERWAVSMHSGEERTRFTSRGDRRVAYVRAGGILADEAEGGSLLGDVSTVGNRSVASQLDRALEDPLTRGVMLDLRGVAGMAQLEELRPRIEKLRDAGKPVVASLESGGGRGDLYLASACTRAFASEEAIFAGLGLRTERRYYREMLERYGVRMDRASVGAFKSAYRNYSVDRTPPPDSIVIQRTLDQRQELFLRSVAASRKIKRERFEHVLDGRGWTSADLVTAGLLDGVGYRDDAWREAGKLSGLGEKPRSVVLSRVEPARVTWTERTPIAVVYATGGIEEGRSGGGFVLDLAGLVGEPALDDEGEVIPRPSDRFDLFVQAAGFASWSRDLIQWLRSGPVVQPINVAGARVRGLEAGLSARVLERVVMLDLAYTLLDTRNDSPEAEQHHKPLPGRPRHGLLARVSGGWRFEVGRRAVGLEPRGLYELEWIAGNTLDLSGRVELPARWLHRVGVELIVADRVRVSLELRNVGDLRVATIHPRFGPRDPYVAPIADFLGFPLPGRSVWATLGFDFDWPPPRR